MGQRRVVAAIAVASVLLLASCRERVQTYDGSSGGATHADVLTPDGTAAYQYANSGGTVTVTPVAGTSGPNLRTVFTPSGVAASTDQESCATWSDRQGQYVQMGAALRVRRGSGRLRAITVTQNVYGWRWIFNVHVWDTASSPPMKEVGQLDFSKALGVPPVSRLHLCARVIGTTVQAKVWPVGQAEPTWTTRGFVGSAAVAKSWVYAGEAGWYVGHLATGDSAMFSGLTTWDHRIASE